jgi:hypothetical protein
MYSALGKSRFTSIHTKIKTHEDVMNAAGSKRNECRKVGRTNYNADCTKKKV